jgi:hypothetical protein
VKRERVVVNFTHRTVLCGVRWRAEHAGLPSGHSETPQVRSFFSNRNERHFLPRRIQVNYGFGGGKPHQPLVLDATCVTREADLGGNIFEAEVLAELKFTLRLNVSGRTHIKTAVLQVQETISPPPFQIQNLALLNHQIRNGSTNSSHLLMPRRHNHRNECLD